MILAIDTASKTATAALVAENEILGEFSIKSEKSHSRVLLPMIDSLLTLTGTKLDDVEFIACTAGPGSFTGLRIGAAAAKSFAFALSKKIAVISALDALAYNVIHLSDTVCAAIDARNKYVTACFYRMENGQMKKLTEAMTVSLAKAVETAQGLAPAVCFVGSGADVYASDIAAYDGAYTASPQFNRHSAGVIGLYALNNLDNLQFVDAKNFKPVYYGRQENENY
jgi:tRNA threonylcarbamoyladenosine biosynthesis protein TsaB